MSTAILRYDEGRQYLELELDGECFEPAEIDDVYEPYADGDRLYIASLGQPPQGLAPDTLYELKPATSTPISWDDGDDSMTFGMNAEGFLMVRTEAETAEGFPGGQVFDMVAVPTTVEDVDEFEGVDYSDESDEEEELDESDDESDEMEEGADDADDADETEG